MKTIKEIKLSDLSLSELKLIAKVRCIKNYENMSKDKLLSAFKKSKPFKDLREIRKENRDENKIITDPRFLYEQENDDYFEPQKQKCAFDDDYIEYESSGDRDKLLSIEEYLNMIKSYLSKIMITKTDRKSN